MNFKKLFNKKDPRTHFSKGESVYIKNPHSAWILLLKVFFLALVVIIALSGYKYYLADKKTIEITVEGSTNTKDVIQVEKLDAILDSFKNKEEKTTEYKTASPVFVDPSR